MLIGSMFDDDVMSMNNQPSQQKMRILSVFGVCNTLASNKHVVHPKDGVPNGRHCIEMSPVTNCRLWCDNKVRCIWSHNSIPYLAKSSGCTSRDNSQSRSRE